jgi:hypothetical protein
VQSRLFAGVDVAKRAVEGPIGNHEEEVRELGEDQGAAVIAESDETELPQDVHLVEASNGELNEGPGVEEQAESPKPAGEDHAWLPAPGPKLLGPETP